MSPISRHFSKNALKSFLSSFSSLDQLYCFIATEYLEYNLHKITSSFCIFFPMAAQTTWLVMVLPRAYFFCSWYCNCKGTLLSLVLQYLQPPLMKVLVAQKLFNQMLNHQSRSLWKQRERSLHNTEICAKTEKINHIEICCC